MRLRTLHPASLMLAIVYVSSAVKPFSNADLSSLLEQSREKNARLRSTGILLYKDGDVMQLIEGPDEAVTSLAKTIYCDSRHRGIIELIKRDITEREFPHLVDAVSRPEPYKIATGCPIPQPW